MDPTRVHREALASPDEPGAWLAPTVPPRTGSAALGRTRIEQQRDCPSPPASSWHGERTCRPHLAETELAQPHRSDPLCFAGAGTQRPNAPHSSDTADTDGTA